MSDSEESNDFKSGYAAAIASLPESVIEALTFWSDDDKDISLARDKALADLRAWMEDKV